MLSILYITRYVVCNLAAIQVGCWMAENDRWVRMMTTARPSGREGAQPSKRAIPRGKQGRNAVVKDWGIGTVNTNKRSY